MNNWSLKSAPRIWVLLTFCILFLYGCKSTAEEELEANCRIEVSGNCSVEGDNGDDRGYNPCLVNNNLPVCKK